MKTIPIGMEQALALIDVLSAARIVVLLDGTDRVSLSELRDAISKYDASTAKDLSLEA
jgi:hypothetical protein